jgi:hypothetical protein
MDQEVEHHTTQKILANLLDDLEENSRFDRWVEFLSAIILSLATVGTAWCGFQVAQWNGQKESLELLASEARLEAAQLTNQATIFDSRNVSIFLAWSSAVNDGNLTHADFLLQRFPPELAVATQAWLETEPYSNLDAPLSPFEMREYQISELDTGQDLIAQAQEYHDRASTAGQIADRYLLFTVFFASVLFFAGISGKFKSRVIDVGMLILATLMVATVLTLMFLNPYILNI